MYMYTYIYMRKLSTYQFYRMSPIFPVKRDPTCKAWEDMICIVSTYNNFKLMYSG